MIKIFFNLCVGVLLIPQFLSSSYVQSQVVNHEIILPISGNTWQKPNENNYLTNQNGIKSGFSSGSFYTYVRFKNIGSVDLSLMLGNVAQPAFLLVSNKEQRFKVSVSTENSNKSVYVGKLDVRDTGYVKIELKVSDGDIGPEVKSYILAGEQSILSSLNYVENNDGNFFYWGRRGPSVHLGYEIPTQEDIEYYYNEITVPIGEDVVGSYYMANGFAEGYFGMQVNSLTERRVLFSVWSPFHTDNPNEIPDEEKIILTKKGEGVNTGEFGNEGSGGQSFLRYDWKAGNTYKFLLKGRPVEKGYTEYTAWFFAEESGEWELIAQFLRPKTKTYLKRFHSFLENFIPSQGDVQRKVLFKNQWVRDVNGNWFECVKARFTADATASAGYRMDYKGGTLGREFYLQNCGFFGDYTPIGTTFKREVRGVKPSLDVNKLPM